MIKGVRSWQARCAVQSTPCVNTQEEEGEGGGRERKRANEREKAKVCDADLLRRQIDISTYRKRMQEMERK